ncbi:hypothetical protein [Brevundimonas sp. Root1423]|uniref:hypothetical protein n=1 Tax=Brevundimonas sp. Root1423 TaxID=1736462 RepID=UPI0006F1D423|nr:hypothetical protein [Brevundimonas sp. Root1423]KQY96485.1 hypothetical protein ASD25_00975 [Brevundimonas sp. Root1423]
MIVLAVAAALIATSPADPTPPSMQQAAPAQQASPVQQQPAEDETPVELDDVEVTGTPLNSLIRNFVNEVAAPNRGRGLARWDDRICIGVANLKTEPAQYIVDRVSTVAEDIGLTPGQPGCTPNVIIIASDDPSALAQALTEERKRAFRMGGTGMDRGGAALRAFETSQAPVRWWQVSMPTNAETGERAVRIPGDCQNACTSPMDAAPIIDVFSASRLSSQIIDTIFRTVVILDVNQVDKVSVVQLADYVAMVTLAQIDPQAETRQYASILNVFESPDVAAGLTDWDKAYLQGLYDAERSRANERAGRTEIVSSIRAAHSELQAQEADD